ncbi:MAG: ribosome silencing factor [Chlorobi bacterium CHB2]|nr:ribosome silencing factor [Chlorobi bacterium CHB2]
MEQTHDTERIRDHQRHPKTIARWCAEGMIEKKAKDIVIMDIRGLTDIADFFVVCSADSDTQLRAIADSVMDTMREYDIKPYRTEGWQGEQWIILDFVEVVVHVFYKEARDFYKIERIWSDAKIETVVDTAGSHAASSEE